MSDKQQITLQLDAHSLQMPVERSMEPVYRQTAALLNERFQLYRKRMPKASAEQLWMYVALEMGSSLKNDARKKSIEPIEQKINELNRLISDKVNQSRENKNNQPT